MSITIAGEGAAAGGIEARLEAWLAAGRDLVAECRAEAQNEVSRVEERVAILEADAALSAAALAQSNAALEAASAEVQRLEAGLRLVEERATRLYDHLVERSRRDLALLAHLNGEAAAPAAELQTAGAGDPSAMALAASEAGSADGASNVAATAEGIVSVVDEAANILGVNETPRKETIMSDAREVGDRVDVVLSLPRPLVASAERLVRAGLAERREDLLRRWLLEGAPASDGGTPVAPCDCERQGRRTKSDRPRR
jgi:phage tail sheath protein FI